MAQEPRLTLDQLATQSEALNTLLEQQRGVRAERLPDQDAIDALTGDSTGPAVFNLTVIWRSALADSGCLSSPGRRRYMSPKRYLNGWPHMVSASVEAPGGVILADEATAFDYVQRVDHRVMIAVHDKMIGDRKAHAAVDPIGNAVSSAKGGPFAMMFAKIDATPSGLTEEEFAEAVMERAKEEAAELGEYAAEKLLSDVRRALEGAPGIDVVTGPG